MPLDLRVLPTGSWRSHPTHNLLAGFAGAWRGPGSVWFDPAAPAQQEAVDAEAEIILGGRFLRITYRSVAAAEPKAGQLLIGYHVGDSQLEATWIDSFHNNSAMMHCIGQPTDDGALVVEGSYPDGQGGPRWGWRTQLLVEGDTLCLDAENIHPDGTTFRALSWRLARVSGLAPAFAGAQS